MEEQQKKFIINLFVGFSQYTKQKFKFYFKMWTIKTNFIPIRPQSILVSWEKAWPLAVWNPCEEAQTQCGKGLVWTALGWRADRGRHRDQGEVDCMWERGRNHWRQALTGDVHVDNPYSSFAHSSVERPCHGSTQLVLNLATVSVYYIRRVCLHGRR